MIPLFRIANFILVASLVQSCASEKPWKGTYTERFYLPPEKLSHAARKANHGDGFSAWQVYMHYHLIERNADEAKRWVQIGAKNGNRTCSEIVRNQINAP